MKWANSNDNSGADVQKNLKCKIIITQAKFTKFTKLKFDEGDAISCYPGQTLMTYYFKIINV